MDDHITVFFKLCCTFTLGKSWINIRDSQESGCGWTSCKNAVKLITSFECVLTELNDPPEA